MMRPTFITRAQGRVAACLTRTTTIVALVALAYLLSSN